MDKEKISELLNKFGGRTAILLGAAALAVAGLVVFFLWNKAPDQQVLFSRLSPEDSGAVIERLKDRKVPYTVDGTTISVPADKVYELRMELAGEGLPQGGGVGFEIFDKTGFGVTDFVQKVNFKRALQGELSRTITQIKEIEAARVHLAIPEKGVFLDSEKKARASVIIKLKPGKSLTQGQVSSIVHLVANSTDNMKPEDVTVVDTAGKMWTSGNESDETMKLTASQLEYKRSLEKDYEARIQSMLEKAVGVNKAVARVALEVDTKQVERTEESYNPDGQVVRSEQRSKESNTGASASGGVPGVLSNLPDAKKNAAAAGNSAPAQSNRQDEVINYEISKVVSHVVEPVGAIRKMSISVLVDGRYETAKGADGKETQKYVARTEDEIAKFTDMVKGAAGYTQDRGDVVTVVSTPFQAEFPEGDMIEAEKPPMVPPTLIPVIIKYATTIVVALLVVFFVLRPIVRNLTMEKSVQRSIEGMQQQQGLPAGSPELALPIITEDESISRLKKVVKDNPQQVAMVLKGWIKDR